MKKLLLLLIVSCPVYLFAQYSHQAEVLSMGGGKSAEGLYSNFGVLGEGIVHGTATETNYTTHIGFIYKAGDTSVNSEPTDILITNTTVDEGSASGTVVGTLSTTDTDVSDTHTYTLVTGTGDTDNASFTIDGNALKTTEVFDYDAKSTYNIRIRTTDDGTNPSNLYYEETFAITVNDIYFTGFPTQGETYSVVVMEVVGITLEIGDEIGVYDNGTSGIGLVGASIYDGTSPVTITTYLADVIAAIPIPGAIEGHDIEFEIWDSSEGVAYNAVPVFGQGGIFGASFATQVTTLTIVTETVVSQQISEGWNMVGLPLEVAHNHVDSLFPNAMDNSLYSWNGAYNLNTTLEKGTGYWLRFPADETVDITGTEFDSIAVDLIQGWNMIAGPSVNVPVGDIEDPGNIIMAGSLYEYAGAYNLADTIHPGNGYWVRTDQGGQIILKASTNKSSNTLTAADMDLHHKISISDNAGLSRILYFNVEPEYPLTKENYMLPPVPFFGIFDARFTGNYRLEEKGYGEIAIQSDNYPLTVSFAEFGQNDDKQYLLKEYVQGALLNTHEVKEGTTITIENASVNLLKVMEQMITPEGFEVDQNRPNPFGDKTEIGYRLPEVTGVVVEIYTMMGQKIATLMNTRQKAGYHTITWDGTDANGNKLSEGIYLYKVTAYGEVQTKRMVLTQ